MPEFEIPLAGTVTHLRVSDRGAVRSVELDGRRVGEIPRPTIGFPWQELPIERDGHTLVVVAVFGRYAIARSRDRTASIEAFADGVNVRDGRTLAQWRAEAPTPYRDIFEMRMAQGFLAPDRRQLARYALTLLPVGVILALVFTRDLVRVAQATLVLAVLLAGAGCVRATQQWGLRRSDLNAQLRVLIVGASFFAPLAALYAVVWASRLW